MTEVRNWVGQGENWEEGLVWVGTGLKSRREVGAWVTVGVRLGEGGAESFSRWKSACGRGSLFLISLR